MRYVLLIVVAICVGLAVVGSGHRDEPITTLEFNPPISDAPKVTETMANVAFGSTLSGERPDGTIGIEEVFPEVEGETLVLRSPSLVEAQAMIPLPEWLDPSAMQDALDMVTTDGLFDRTSDWWNQPDFLNLTGDQLALLVPESATLGYAFAGEKTLVELVGGLPTFEDVERGFADVEVQRALMSVVTLEIPINSLGMTPFADRNEQWQADFDKLVASMHAREIDLAHELDRASGYKHWEILQRAFAAWRGQ